MMNSNPNLSVDTLFKVALIIDDQSIARMGIKIVLENKFPHVVILEAANGEEALGILQTVKVDWCTMDINMPNTNALELLKQMLAFQPECKVIVVSMCDPLEFEKPLLELGAYDFVSKNQEFEHVLGKLQATLDKKTKQHPTHFQAEMNEMIDH